MRLRFTALAAAQILANCRAAAQLETAPSPLAAPTESVIQERTNQWVFGASAYTYIVPQSRDYVQPTLAADREWLHLEARYNYEDFETGSTWLGVNLGGGDGLAWELTPMLGGVFGRTTGIAPGYKGSLSWWKLEFYSEGEYVADTGAPSESYFYNWSELSLTPVDWFRFGLVTQRTRVYKSDREIQRGVLAGFTYRNLDLTGYVLNPDESKPTVVIGLTCRF